MLSRTAASITATATLVALFQACVPASRTALGEEQRLAIVGYDSQLLGDSQLAVGGTLFAKAVFMDPLGVVVGPADAVWNIATGDFAATDLSGVGLISSMVEFRPTRPGSAVLVATYVGTERSPDSRTAVSGVITVSSGTAPTRMSMVAGNGQSLVVGSNATLAIELSDVFDEPSVGVTVDFEVTAGSGSLSAGQAVTDAAGRARLDLTLGLTAGVASDRVRATTDAAPQLAAEFSINALAASPTVVAFLTEPANGLAAAIFAPQPAVSISDAFGNGYQGPERVTLSVAVGTGQLLGTLTSPVAAGVARFTDVAYDTSEAGVVLRAEFLGMTVDTSSFNIALPSPGSCQRQDSRFASSDGGCLDVNTGLIWSALQVGGTWHTTVWDATLSGSDPADVDDAGASNDYPAGQGCPRDCDAGIRGDCHTLSEGGFDDWRAATIEELILVHIHADAGMPPYLASPDPTWGLGLSYLWSSTSEVEGTFGYAMAPSGNWELLGKGSSQNMYCVRRQRSAPAALDVLAPTSGVGVGFPAREALIVQVADGDGRPVNIEGLGITISAGTAGTLSGTLSAFTDNAGQARFTDWSFDTVGALTVEALSTTGLVGQAAINVGAFPHTCAVENDVFRTAAGGCEHVASGLVWSDVGGKRVLWGDVVWDANEPAINIAPDPHDAGRTNDYSSNPGWEPDDSALNLCHELREAGFQDWRPPTDMELMMLTVPGAGAARYFGFDADISVWSSTTVFTGGVYKAVIVNLATGARFEKSKTTNFAGYVCVRDPNASPTAKLLVVDSPRALGVGAIPIEALTAQVVTAADEPRYAQALTVTLSTNLGTLTGTTIAKTNSLGRVVFDAFTLDTLGDATLTLSTPSLAGDTTVVRVGSQPHSCLVDDTVFATADGGCQQQGNKLVWSRPAPTAMTWFAAVWDSVSVSNNSAPELSDGGRTDDYDGFPPGFPDNSAANYCHELVEGARDDWRVPAAQELIDAQGLGASTHFATDVNQNFMSGATSAFDPLNAMVVNLWTGSSLPGAKTSPFQVICVRQGL